MSRLEALLDLHRQDPNDADLLYMIATELVNAGRHADAIPMLAQYVERGPDVGAGWALLADCHEALGQVSDARGAVEQGIAAALRGGHPTLAAELRDRLDEMG